LRRAILAIVKARTFCLVLAIAALSGCGSSTGSTMTTPSLTAKITSVSPSGTAIVNATIVAMTGDVTPSTPNATFDWQFGDGATASGQTVSHLYTQEGSPTITLRVSSGGSSATITQAIQVKSITGCWQETTKSSDRAQPDTNSLIQTGANISGTYISTPSDPAVPRLVLPLTGSVISPKVLSYTGTDSKPNDDRGYTVTANDALTQLSGTQIRLTGQTFVTLVPAAANVCQ
jgi:PKD repeat protein